MLLRSVSRLAALALSLLLASAGAAAPQDQVAGHPWSWPVSTDRRVVKPFRAPAHEYGPGHRGMDISTTIGAPVTAPAGGVVAFRGTVVDRPLITVDHGDGHVSTWEPVSSPLHPGDPVAAGDALGVVARGGHAAVGTLHVGVRRDGGYINPLPLFGQIPRAVLLPCCE